MWSNGKKKSWSHIFSHDQKSEIKKLKKRTVCGEADQPPVYSYLQPELSAFLAVLRQQLSPHKLNKLSFCDKNSNKHSEETQCPPAHVDQPRQPAFVTAEQALKPDVTKS